MNLADLRTEHAALCETLESNEEGELAPDERRRLTEQRNALGDRIAAIESQRDRDASTPELAASWTYPCAVRTEQILRDDSRDFLEPPRDWGVVRRGVLTTDHAASSQGLPVVVVDGVALGPADLGPHEVQPLPPGLTSEVANKSDVARAGEVAELARAAGYTVCDPDPYVTSGES